MCLLGLGGCSKNKENAPTGDGERAAANAQPDPCAGAQAKHGMSWFDDDYAAALACARAKQKPLFVDLWAPWCHTCLSMQEFVFPDPGLATLADRFVWLAIDTDKTENAPVVEKFPPEVWPTFYIVGPADESVLGRYLGSAPVGVLREFLLQGESAHSRAGTLPEDSPMGLLGDAERALVAKDTARAVAGYRAVLERAPADWPLRPSVLVSLVVLLAEQKDWTACADLAESALEQTGRSANATDFIYQINRCAGELEPERARRLRERSAAHLRSLIDDPAAPLSVDDRSDAMVNLRELLIAMGDKQQADILANEQRRLLDAAAAAAPSPWAAMTHNWPRAEVYVYLGKGQELVPILEKSAKDLPTEYDPPYRLAWVLNQSGQPEKALAPALAAAKLAYGPRKGRVLGLIADIYKALGDKGKERATRQDLVAHYAGLPAGQLDSKKLEDAKGALAAMDAE